MYSDEQRDRLLAEAYHENWENGHLAGAALQAARGVRRRRRAKRVAAALAVIVGCAGTWLALSSRVAKDTVAVAAATPMAQSRPVGYETISDGQLRDALKDRQMLWVRGDRGYVDAVFLDERAGTK